MELRLRRAKDTDVDLVFQWANEPEVRKNSFSSEPIPYESHCAWFAKKLSDAEVGFYILEYGQTPVGQLRYEVDRDMALTNYSIAKEYRGRGLGKTIIAMGEQRLLADYPAVSTVIAYVKRENTASAKVFRNLGYVETCQNNEFAYKKEIRK